MAWEEFLDDQKLGSEIRGTNYWCSSTNELVFYFFGLILGYKVYSHTDNLSKSLQSTNMSSTGGKSMADVTLKVSLKIIIPLYSHNA